jgi:hypothetical protein
MEVVCCSLFDLQCFVSSSDSSRSLCGWVCVRACVFVCVFWGSFEVVQ